MGGRLEFGISIVPAWADPGRALELTRLAEDAGLDLVGVQDHPYQWRFLDTWTLISWLAAHTARVRFFPDVANLPLRPPAILAKAAASLDVLSGGRVELGIGAGGFWEAIGAIGGPVRTPAEAVEATEEAIDVIRLLWSGERDRRYEGRFYNLDGVNAGPRPAHEMGIWMGAGGPRMLRLLGRKADGWVPSAFGSVREDLPANLRLIDEAATAAGRDPAAIRRILNVGGTIEPLRGGSFEGPASYWVDQLSNLVEVGMDAFVFWPSHDEARQVELFATEVVPAVRATRGSEIR